MLRRCTSESGVSRGTSTSLRRSLSVTSAARSISDRLVPWAIAAKVPIEHGHTTIPSVFTDPDAGCAPRSASLNRRTHPQSSPVACFKLASSLMPHSSASRRQPCADMSSHVGTWLVARVSSRRTAYGAPEAPVIASTSGAEGVATAGNIALNRPHVHIYSLPRPRGLRPHSRRCPANHDDVACSAGAHATRGGGAAASLRRARQRTHRPVLLAARARQSGSHQVPRGRKRIYQGGHGAHAGVARPAVRGVEGARAAGRSVCSLPAGRLLLLYAARGG